MGDPNFGKRGFGSRPKEVDDAYRAMAKGVKRKRKWTKEKCIFQLEDLMDTLQKKIENDDLKELSIIVDKMMDIIKYLFPPVNSNVNLNIDVTTDAVMERLKDWKQNQVIEIVAPEGQHDSDL